MRKLRIVICDDEPLYVQEIKNNIQSIISEKGISAQLDLFTDSSNLFNNPKSYDIAFLDIEMFPHNGIKTAEKLKSINPNIIIFFITSYEKYLDDAMDINAFRYIRKPLNSRRFKTSLEKAFQQINNSQITFFLKKDGESIVVPVNDIIYIEIVKRSTKIVTQNGTFISENNIGFWADKLVMSFFYQVHKSFIINMKCITNYSREKVTLNNIFVIPIAYRKQAQFRSYFFSFFGEN